MYHLESNWDKIILNHKIPFKKPNPNDDIYKLENIIITKFHRDITNFRNQQCKNGEKDSI